MAGIVCLLCGPEDRELNAFLRWFDCSFHSMVFDVCDERLRHTNI